MAANRWILRHQPQPAASLRIFCFPYAGAGASVYRGWAARFRADVEVCAVQLPGRENRLGDRPFRAMEELIPVLAQELTPLLDRPYVFYGHSLGGKVAFEVARSVRRTGGRQPSHLFVGASSAPHLPWAHPPLRDLPEADLFEALQRRYGAFAEEVLASAEWREILAPVLRTDIAMVETYRYIAEAPLACGITAFGGAADATVPASALAEWRHQTSGNARTQLLRGGHFFLDSAQGELLGAVEAELARLR